eukprot:jgi/Tetstr1/448408/TSEL_035678.t1
MARVPTLAGGASQTGAAMRYLALNEAPLGRPLITSPGALRAPHPVSLDSSSSRGSLQRVKGRRRELCAHGGRGTPPAAWGAEADPLRPDALLPTAVAAFGGAAVLGPLCDGQHSSHDVLHYSHPALLQMGPLFRLESCWWVPVLFGVAGVILSVSHPTLDRSPFASTPALGLAPSWTVVYAGNAAFVLHYAASGALEAPLRAAGPLLLDGVLAGTAVLLWAVLDRSRQGLLMALAAALGGPLIEVVLINQLHLYSYTHPDVLGIPSWICWVYFSGAPAVGNLGRRIYADVSAKPPQ